MLLRVYWYLFVSEFAHNNGIIHQIAFGWFTLYVLLYITIKSDMQNVQKIVNNLIYENIDPLKVNLIKQDG